VRFIGRTSKRTLARAKRAVLAAPTRREALMRALEWSDADSGDVLKARADAYHEWVDPRELIR
jgi:hypothetical protein